MSFTVSEVLEAAKAGMDENITADEALTAINEALGWLGDMAYEDKEIQYIIQAADTLVPLPEDFIKVVLVTGDTGGKVTPMGQSLHFDNAGNYTVNYRAVPPLVTSTTDRVPMHDIYRQPLITFLRSWAKLHDDDESVEGNNLRQLWMNDAQRAFVQLKRNKWGPATVRLQRGVVLG